MEWGRRRPPRPCGSRVRDRVAACALAAPPRTGQTLEGSVGRARLPGYDLMFSVPKSASILFGVGGPMVQRTVLAAQHAAVEAGLQYLEARACRTRRGAGGCEILAGDGFVGA